MATEGREYSHQSSESNEEMAEMLFPRRRCCFCIPCFRWQRMSTAENDGRWWSRGISALMKVREWSEIVAGPRWKTFIRRFNRSKSGGGSKHAKFQYDPLSYALNFDDSVVQAGEVDEEYGFRHFSARFAAVPVTAKSSMDLGKDAPTFT